MGQQPDSGPTNRCNVARVGWPTVDDVLIAASERGEAPSRLLAKICLGGVQELTRRHAKDAGDLN